MMKEQKIDFDKLIRYGIVISVCLVFTRFSTLGAAILTVGLLVAFGLTFIDLLNLLKRFLPAKKSSKKAVQNEK